MDTFIGPDNPLGYPAPYWFLVLFKVLGFSLHVVPMSLWYAGLITMLVIRQVGGEHARRLSERVINAMPVVVAYGINLGIIPLLFIQVAYYKVFYPATILMAWFWFGVIGLLLVAYYGVYIYVTGLRRDRLPPVRQAAGWVASLLFVVLGFIFANGLSLMVNVGAWGDLWAATNVAGAPLGLALNVGDASLWPRWLMMFGLALTTTAAYVVVDAGFFAGQESDEYKRWAMRFALALYTLGMVWYAATGTWYIFGSLPTEARAAMLQWPVIALTLLTGASVGLPWLLILIGRRGVTRALALLVGLAQFGVIALNAVSRQILQNVELAPYLDVTAEQVNMQWSPMILFLVLFVAGLGVTWWMIAQVVKANRASAAAG
jgi:hypothetical protein